MTRITMNALSAVTSFAMSTRICVTCVRQRRVSPITESATSVPKQCANMTRQSRPTWCAKNVPANGRKY